MLGNLNIGANQIRYWLQGPVAQYALSQDIGWMPTKPAPVVVLTFITAGCEGRIYRGKLLDDKAAGCSYSVVLKAEL
jgi:hypothetical protein